MREAIGRLMRFGMIGLVSTFVYGVIAFGLTRLAIMPVALASFVAFACAGVFSYFGHRLFTFRTRVSHNRAAVRFAGVNVLAYLIATVLPLLVSDVLGYNAIVGIGLVCIVVPAINFILLSFVVFEPGRERGETARTSDGNAGLS